jgi:hypothetical protein
MVQTLSRPNLPAAELQRVGKQEALQVEAASASGNFGVQQMQTSFLCHSMRLRQRQSTFTPGWSCALTTSLVFKK